MFASYNEFIVSINELYNSLPLKLFYSKVININNFIYREIKVFCIQVKFIFHFHKVKFKDFQSQFLNILLKIIANNKN